MDITFIAIFVAWAVLVFHYPRFFTILLSAFFPLYLLKFEFYGIPFTFVEWLTYATAFALLIVYRKKALKWFDEFFEGNIFIKIEFWVFAFFIVNVVAVFIVPAEARNQALGILKGWIFAPIVYFFVVKGFIKNLADARRLLDAYLGSAVVLSVIGIYQYMHGILIDNRVTGLFASANYLAFFIAPAFVYAAILAWQNIRVIEMPWWKKVFIKLFRKEVDETNTAFFFAYLGCALITGFALTATNSYGAFIGVIFAAILYSIYHYCFSPWRQNLHSSVQKIVIFAVLLVAFLGLIVPKLDAWKFNTLFTFKDGTSSAIRLETWQVAGDLIVKNPVMGIGLGQFQNEYSAHAEEILGRAPVRSEMLHPHNVFMTTWLYTGIIGLFIFLAILFQVFMLLKNKNSDVRKRLIVVLAAMMLVIVMHGFVDTPFWKNDLAMQFWLIAGCAFGLSKK
ncbi:MAG: exopolysaccharide biosynthesis family protein [Candidatus Peregrinibacteria bacterium GW2011_GWC2_39_14]|nr:MAG: exopolysaccharide biosynthesis family protein [Candidatus Peregrinibacteria bacterium GW2011_GWC2_39_14]